eukprot:TRINITY_DN26072_c0_g1_i1.p1 TRINITY_DN26072_c0_g1~~TRINITY_DN26072_c0_g1_i1.p1  ORF type:complete len:235 (-),score=50.17 TRINITY_DN26072_c0_g1_i1:88-792(-)
MNKIVLILFLVVSALCVVSCQTSFNARDIFLGDWEIEYSRYTTQGDLFVPDSLLENWKWRITNQNETTTLVGDFFDDKGESIPFWIEFDESSPTVGRFLCALDDDPEAEEYTFMSFDFANYSNGVYYSQGPFRFRKHTGSYQMSLPSPVQLLITYNIKDEQGRIIQNEVLSGRKILEKKDPGFLSKYGMPMVMLGVFLVMQFFKNRGDLTGAAPAPAAGAAPVAAAPAATKKNN